jgi:hypothetical protein
VITRDASFGRNAAGQINVVTRSRTNAPWFTAVILQNSALDARNFFAPADEPAPTYNREQAGGSIGGPIARNRTFFFADYEHTRRREGITQVTNVPTQAERNGDFSQSLLPPPRDPTTGQPFSNSTIPDFYIHPVGREIAALYPLPNRPTPMANFVSSPTLRDDADHFDVRIDQKAGTGGQLFTRYSFDDRRFFEPFPSSVAVPGYGTDVPRRGQNLSVGWTKPFGARFVNETRFAYSRVAIGVFQEQGPQHQPGSGAAEISSNPRDFGLPDPLQASLRCTNSQLPGEHDRHDSKSSTTFRGRRDRMSSRQDLIFAISGRGAYRDVMSWDF